MGASRRSVRVPGILTLAWVVLLGGCARPQPLTKEQTIALIESSPSWSQPLESSLNVDPSFRASPTTKRELLKLEALTVKDDGPWGIAGQTATGSFTWRWAEGYMQGKTFRSRVKLNNSGDGWKVYHDKLRDALWAAERGDID
jgi:hypothetical protein